MTMRDEKLNPPIPCRENSDSSSDTCGFWWCAEVTVCFATPRRAEAIKSAPKKKPKAAKKNVALYKSDIPSVLIQVATKKDKILAKTGGLCWLCEEKINQGEYSQDHKIPVSRGGSGKLENLWPAHIICNGLKADYLIKSPEDFKKCFPDYKHQLSITFKTNNHANNYPDTKLQP